MLRALRDLLEGKKKIFPYRLLIFEIVLDLSAKSRAPLGLDALRFGQFPARVFFLSHLGISVSQEPVWVDCIRVELCSLLQKR